MDMKTAFDRRLNHIPIEWRGPLVDVIDTIEIVKTGLSCIGIEDNFLIIEATRLVLDRHDKSSNAEE